MRNYTFRIYDKREKKMIGGMNIYALAGYLCSCRDKGRDLQDFVLSEFTGFPDSRGVGIYEGDILKQKLNGKELVGVMVWNAPRGGFGMEAFVGENSNFDPVYEVHVSKEEQNHPRVIGNIFENADLLKGNIEEELKAAPKAKAK